jgi:geranylgeranyl diphosphate synthase type II
MTSPSDAPAEPAAFDEYARARRATVDAELERLLPAPPACPPLIADAMRYTVFGGGKRLRPLLALAAADSVSPGGTAQDRDVLPAACAVELIHAYSLVHDDLPAMDDDTLRRGQPTAHVVYGEGIAILAGDALLTEAFRVLARSSESETADRRGRRLRTLERIATAAGAEGMVGGQVIDLAATGATAAFDADRLRAMHGRKTGALIRAAAVAGAIMGGASDADADAVDRYAAHLGLAFQIVDDILDVEGAQEAIGKTAGKDADAGKPTYPALFGLDESRRLAAGAIGEAKAALEAAGIGGRLFEIADWVLGRTR